MADLFISHASADDGFVHELRVALADHGPQAWIDSRELRGGSPLWTDIESAITGAKAFLVIVSPAALQSEWVGKELAHAVSLQKQRGKGNFPIIPIALDGTRLGVLTQILGEEPVYIPASTQAGGIAAAMNAILVALGRRLPADQPPTAQPKAEPLEELVLELSDLQFRQQDGVRRATARARLVYQPATPGEREVASTQSWRLVAPTGPIEAAELAWYLEQYAIWPSGIAVIRERARRVEHNLVTWGCQIHEQALPAAHTANVMQAWVRSTSRTTSTTASRTTGEVRRRFSVMVDATQIAGATADETNTAQEAATELLRLPWELLHDGQAFLFQGARPVRVRRRLPNTQVLDVPVVAPPIRILLVSARPEDDACGYIDHRASALPLVAAMEALPGLVALKVLNPPTLPALREELERARSAGQPYHVVHFDGHGVYNPRVGLGGLCFEHPSDVGKLVERRHVTVYTTDSVEHGTGIGSLLREHRVPLVFLEACQTAQADKASESLASELLKVGVASVVAMTHSVLVETAQRFVGAFYQALAQGKRVGDAMLAGQRRLKDDTGRGAIFGSGELRLEDWFVPVLYQEKDDPQLFTAMPSPQTLEDAKARLAARLGETPAPPATGFVGRSRDLLALQRLLQRERYAVVRGQGGEGKTTLAAEFARWMVRSQQIKRATFVSVEAHGHQQAVVDALGRQLVGQGFTAAADLEAAILQVERELREQATLLVVDNMESILLPPYLAQEAPEALSAEAQEDLTAILALCARLLRVGQTRIVFTSREALPAPFDAEHHRCELHRLSRADAVKLVERALNNSEDGTGAVDAKADEIEALVDAVHGHARTLALLAPALRERGVAATRESLTVLMAQMEQRFPGNREQSVFASVALSLRRLSPENRERARVLGVFHGSCDLDVLRTMMGWEQEDVIALARELIATGLATPNRYGHLTLNPALCPWLRGQLEAAERQALEARWVKAMGAYARFLNNQQSEDAEMAATLTVLELPNLWALLGQVQRAGDAEATIALATRLYGLLQVLGRPRLLAHLGQVRDAAEVALDEGWSHARFEAARTRIEQQLASHQLRPALAGSQALLQRARAAGARAYAEADYDLAVAGFLLARVLETAGGAEQALPLLDEARRGFEAFEAREPGRGAAGMASTCITESGDCLRALGRLDHAAAAYTEAIGLAERRSAVREVAVGKGQLGSVRILQGRYPEALAAYAEARERFQALDEPGSVAVVWHQTGMVYEQTGQPQAAEAAYRESLTIEVQLRNVAGQASTLFQLGTLYDDMLNQPEEAVAFYCQAAGKYVDIGDLANEGRVRSNLADTLRKLRRHDEARHEVLRAIECKAAFGHASEPWTSWAILAGIEADTGRTAEAAEARAKALAAYLAYRRDGGENQNGSGRLALAVTQTMHSGKPDEASTLLQQLAANPEATHLHPFVHALQAIVAGSRDRSLAEAPELHYSQAAEILLLIETLQAPQPPDAPPAETGP